MKLIQTLQNNTHHIRIFLVMKLHSHHILLGNDVTLIFLIYSMFKITKPQLQNKTHKTVVIWFLIFKKSNKTAHGTLKCFSYPPFHFCPGPKTGCKQILHQCTIKLLVFMCTINMQNRSINEVNYKSLSCVLD